MCFVSAQSVFLASVDSLLDAGVVDGVFVADAGLTCCVFAKDTLFAGDDSGILHLLELPRTS